MDKTKPVPQRVTMDGGIGVLGSLGGLALILALTIVPLKVVGARVPTTAAPSPVTRSTSMPVTRPRCRTAPRPT
jgi:ubiquinol-cytochrome c reductase cytochrome b subunit